MNTIKIVNANANSRALSLAAVGADVMIVDPPYAANVHSKAISARTGGVGVKKRNLGFGHLTTDFMLRIAFFAAQVRRWSVVFCDVESLHLWQAAMRLYGVEYVRPIMRAEENPVDLPPSSAPWIRWSQPQMSGDRPPTGAEMIAIFHAPRPNGGKLSWNGPGGRIAYVAKSLRGKEKYSCEKPLDLMLALVSDFSLPGETVFDPCCGVGTTLQAARILGRSGVGVERLKEPAYIAATRVISPPKPAEIDRLQRWVEGVHTEASTVPAPRKPAERATWERAQRRLRDVTTAIRWFQEQSC